MALGPIQPVTEINIKRVKAAGARIDNTATFICHLSRNPERLKLLEVWGPFQVLTGTASVILHGPMTWHQVT